MAIMMAEGKLVESGESLGAPTIGIGYHSPSSVARPIFSPSFYFSRRYPRHNMSSAVQWSLPTSLGGKSPAIDVGNPQAIWTREYSRHELKSLAQPVDMDEGEMSEYRFLAILEAASDRFKDVCFAKPYDDLHNHFDLQAVDSHGAFVGGRSSTMTNFDVKSAKVLSRHVPDAEREVLADHVWVELHGRRERGWLTQGRADAIAFETQPGRFLVVRRWDLRQYVEQLTRGWGTTTEATQAKERIYVDPTGDSDNRTRLALIAIASIVRLPTAEWLDLSTVK